MVPVKDHGIFGSDDHLTIHAALPRQLCFKQAGSAWVKVAGDVARLTIPAGLRLVEQAGVLGAAVSTREGRHCR